MKIIWILIILVCVVVSWMVFVVVFAKPQTGPLPGDVSVDGRVDCADMTIVRDAMGKRNGQVGYVIKKDNGQLYIPDINQDGLIDQKDLDIVASHLPKGMQCL